MFASSCIPSQSIQVSYNKLMNITMCKVIYGRTINTDIIVNYDEK